MKIALAFLWALVVLGLIGIGTRLLRQVVLVPEPVPSVSPTPEPPKPQKREVKLYFADPNASALLPENRFAKLGAGTVEDAATIANELIRGPQLEGFFPTIPPGTRLINAYQIGDTLVLNFSHELQTNHPGGSIGELLTVYSVVNTMTESLDGVDKVQILMEGLEIETLAGHMDLTKPLSPDKKWMLTLPRAEAER